MAGTSGHPNAKISVPLGTRPPVAKEELDSLIENALHTVLPTTGSDLDEADNDFDSDIDEKPQLTSEGHVIPKNEIVVMEQALVSDVMKQKTNNKHCTSRSSLSKKVIFRIHYNSSSPNKVEQVYL